MQQDVKRQTKRFNATSWHRRQIVGGGEPTMKKSATARGRRTALGWGRRWEPGKGEAEWMCLSSTIRINAAGIFTSTMYISLCHFLRRLYLANWLLAGDRPSTGGASEHILTAIQMDGRTGGSCSIWFVRRKQRGSVGVLKVMPGVE